jgi:hypothetical protein
MGTTLTAYIHQEKIRESLPLFEQPKICRRQNRVSVWIRLAFALHKDVYPRYAVFSAGMAESAEFRYAERMSAGK